MKFGEKNVGNTDKAVRIVVGLALFGAILLNLVDGVAMYVALVLGLAMFATAFFGTCSLYSLLGVNTCEIKKRK